MKILIGKGLVLVDEIVVLSQWNVKRINAAYTYKQNAREGKSSPNFERYFWGSKREHSS